MLLGEGPMRFNELRRSVGGISQRMLTLTVRGLERDGFVTYELTPLGRLLLTPIQQLGSWTMQNIDLIEDAQRRFDQASGRDAAARSPAPAARVNVFK
jgi:DNA-binding HxlR family transcriptional regulator